MNDTPITLNGAHSPACGMAMLALISLLLGAAAPSGADIASHGTNHGALPCMACHGAEFQGNPSIGAPRLAGQPEVSTLAALKAIASGRLGTNTAMQNIAASLTPAERAAVANYFAGLKAETVNRPQKKR